MRSAEKWKFDTLFHEAMCVILNPWTKQCK